MEIEKPLANRKGDRHEKHKEVLASIVKEMAKSITGAQSTKHWAEHALRFDVPAFASRGIQPALKMFDRVFNGFSSCDIEILEEDVTINGDMGLVCMIQKVNIVLKTAMPSARGASDRFALNGEAVSGN